jgi:hypothetical protein
MMIMAPEFEKIKKFVQGRKDIWQANGDREPVAELKEVYRCQTLAYVDVLRAIKDIEEGKL